MDGMDSLDEMDRSVKTNRDTEGLLPKHGGYRKLKSFQLSQLVYDLTVRFCELYIDRFSRTHDQMVQAARSGVQNIAEGSQASGTSRKTELKLTNVARASLEELKLDYEDFLRQGGYTLWADDDPRRKALVQRRCSTADEVAQWIREVRNNPCQQGGQAEHNGLNGQHGQGASAAQPGDNRPPEPHGHSDHDGYAGQKGISAEFSAQSISSIQSIVLLCE